MKKLFYLFLVLGLFACSSDSADDDENNNDEQNTSEFDYGILAYYGNDGISSGNYNFDIILLSDEIDLHCGDEEATGSGKALYFEIFTSNSSGLDEGTYNYSDNFGVLGTWDIGEYCTDCNPTEENANFYSLTSGTVTIAKSGSTYSISWDCTSSTGFGVSGSYTGSLEYCDVEPD